jgi:hypothetical protein
MQISLSWRREAGGERKRKKGKKEQQEEGWWRQRRDVSSWPFQRILKNIFFFPPFDSPIWKLVYIFTPFLPWRLSDIRMETNEEKQQTFLFIIFLLLYKMCV